MKKRKPLTVRQLLLAGGLLTAFALLTLSLFSFPKKESGFEAFSRELYNREMTANTLSLHYSLADPGAFGIEDYPVRLPCYLPGSETAENSFLAETLQQVKALSGDRLSFQERYACGLLERNLSLALQMREYPYYSEPLSPTQGAQCQLPILLSEYAFRSKQDVEDYLTLLGQTGAYFSSLLIYEQEKAAAGNSMSAYCLSQAADQCDTIVTKQELEQGTHFLQTSFLDRLKELSASVKVTKGEAKEYIRRSNDLLMNVLLPAYQELGGGLRQLEVRAPQVTGGLASLPKGQDYYRLLLSAETGSSRTVEEIRALLQKKMTEEYDAIRQLAKDYPGCLPALAAGTYTELGLEGEEAMLEDLRRRMAADFPALPEGNSPAVTVKTVSDSLSDYCAPAYYLTSPIDRTDTNVIYINPKSDPDDLELYTTLAHEGFPGHLYQNTYTAANFLSMGESRLRQLVYTGGYLEGWALYVEQYAYDYASRLLAEQGRPADAVCAQIEKHNRSLQLCLYSLLDIMIHCDGAGLSDIYDALSAFGITDRNAVSLVYTYICQSPCNYPKYYLGFLEILELKQTARELWQEDYSDTAFHRFFLEWGPGDFTGLRDVLSHYRPHAV